MTERVIDIINRAAKSVEGSGNYVECSEPGYDWWSGPGQLPEVYCKYYAGDTVNLRTGVCKVRLAEACEKLVVETDAIDLSVKVPDPYVYYPVDSSLAEVMIHDIKGSSAGLEPERCLKCTQSLNGKAAGRIIGRVLQKLT